MVAVGRSDSAERSGQTSSSLDDIQSAPITWLCGICMPLLINRLSRESDIIYVGNDRP